MRGVFDDRAGEALRAAARFGPYFAWERHDGGAGWRSLRELFDADVVAARVDAGRQTLARMGGLDPGELPERVVASTIFLGLASRLLSPLVAAVAVAGVLPLPDPDRMWWRAVGSGPVPIAWQGLDVVGGAEAAEVFRRQVEPLLAVFRARFVLSPQVLWGNVAAALGGAAGMIADGEPGAAERAAAVVAAALRVPPLLGAAELVRPDPARDRWFLVRRNCCLYYRIPGGGTCGDCVLTPEAVRRRAWAAVLARGTA